MFPESSTFSKTIFDFLVRFFQILLLDQGASMKLQESSEKMEDFSLKMYCSQNILTLTFFSSHCIILAATLRALCQIIRGFFLIIHICNGWFAKSSQVKLKPQTTMIEGHIGFLHYCANCFVGLFT